MLIVVVLPAACAGSSGEWSAEERLTVQFPTRASDLMVDVSEDGSAIAAWDCYDPSTLRTSAWVATYDPEKGWTGGSLLDGTAYSSSAQDVAMSNNGTAVAVWDAARNGYDVPMAAVYVAGEGWQERVALSTQQIASIYAIDAAVNEHGETVAAWDAEINGAHLIMTAIYSPTAGWSEAATLITSAHYQADPMVGISDRGDAMVAWREWRENPDNSYTGILRYSTYSAASGWSAQAIVNDDDVNLGSPAANMEMNGRGEALLAYSCEVTGSARAESRGTFYDGAAWRPAATLSEEDDQESACPDVGLADDGWGMVVWGQWNGTIREYQYRTLENGTFGPLGMMPHGAVSGLNWPYIDVSEGRKVIATTLAATDGEDEQHAYAVRYSPADGWSAWERLDLNSLNSVYFLVRGGIDAQGNAVAAWISYDEPSGQNCSVWASSYAVDEVVVQEVDPRGEIDALRGQLNLAVLVAVVAMVIATASSVLLLWKMRGKRQA